MSVRRSIGLFGEKYMRASVFLFFAIEYVMRLIYLRADDCYTSGDKLHFIATCELLSAR